MRKKRSQQGKECLGFKTRDLLWQHISCFHLSLSKTFQYRLCRESCFFIALNSISVSFACLASESKKKTRVSDCLSNELVVKTVFVRIAFILRSLNLVNLVKPDYRMCSTFFVSTEFSMKISCFADSFFYLSHTLVIPKKVITMAFTWFSPTVDCDMPSLHLHQLL